MADTTTENLEKRIAELEAQLEDRDKESKSESRTERARGRKNRLIRGAVHASVAGVGAVADAFSTFADSVLDSNRGEDKDSAEDTNRRVFGDVTSGVTDAFDELLEVPEKMADRFSERYKDRS